MRSSLGLAAALLAAAVVFVGCGLALQAGLRDVSAHEPAGQARELRRLQADLAARERRAVVSTNRSAAGKRRTPVPGARAQRRDPSGRSSLDSLWRAYPL